MKTTSFFLYYGLAYPISTQPQPPSTTITLTYTSSLLSSWNWLPKWNLHYFVVFQRKGMFLITLMIMKRGNGYVVFLFHFFIIIYSLSLTHLHTQSLSRYLMHSLSHARSPSLLLSHSHTYSLHLHSESKIAWTWKIH